MITLKVKFYNLKHYQLKISPNLKSFSHLTNSSKNGNGVDVWPRLCLEGVFESQGRINVSYNLLLVFFKVSIVFFSSKQLKIAKKANVNHPISIWKIDQNKMGKFPSCCHTKMFLKH